MSHRKMSSFVSFPSFVFTSVKKWTNFDSESHCNTLILSDKNDMTSDLNILYIKMSEYSILK